jgi:hypothetical protein
MILRDRFGLTPEDLEDMLADQEQEIEKLHAEIERRGSPAGNPRRSGEAGTSPEGLCPKGLSERSITCARCGRELHSLEQIRAALELAPGEALGEGQEKHPQDAYSFALGHLTCAVAEVVRDLACHAGTCSREDQKETP